MAERPTVSFDDRYYRRDEVDSRHATRSLMGLLKLGGDLGGTAAAPKVLSVDGIDVSGIERTSRKNSASGYAGLNASNRLTKGSDVTDDLIVDVSGKGLVLKAGTGEYVRIGVNVTLGIATLTLTVLGGKP
jgi:hypothetical protein